MGLFDKLNIVVNEPTFYLEDYVFTIYGVPGAGKTTTAIAMGEIQYGSKDKSLLFAIDKGYKTMKGVHALPINSWEELKKGVQVLVKGKKTGESEYRLVIFDTVSMMYDLAEKYILRKEGAKRNKTLEALSDVPYGALYNLLDKEVEDVIRALQGAGYGIIFIDHDQHTEETTREGDKYTIINTSMSKRARKFVVGMSDVLMYLDYSRHFDDEGEMYSERKIYLDNESTIAETKNRFRNMPSVMPLDPAKFLQALEESIKGEHEDEGHFEEAQKLRSAKKKEEVKINLSEDDEVEATLEEASTSKSAEELIVELKDVLQKLSKEEQKSAVANIKKQYGGLAEMNAEQLQEAIEKYEVKVD